MSNVPPYMLQSWPTTRQFLRKDLEARVTITTATGPIRGWCADVSEGGMAGVSSAKLTLGDEVALEFTLPGGDEAIEVRAIVRYASGFRYGFEFLTLAPRQRNAIRAYCDSKRK